MKNVFEALKVTGEDTFVTAVAKNVSRGYIKAVISTLTFVVKITSSKETLAKFKEEMEA